MGRVVAGDGMLTIPVGVNEANHKRNHPRAIRLEIDRNEEAMIEPDDEISLRHENRVIKAGDGGRRAESIRQEAYGLR